MCMSSPRGIVAGTLAATAIAWAPYVLFPGTGIAVPMAQSVLYAALLVLTIRSRRLKVLVVRGLQRWTINPLMRGFLAIGINPLGLAILETRGRISGKPRRTPVGNGRQGNDFWIIAEHGTRSNYVRNIGNDSRVRVRFRRGLRYRWVQGHATVLDGDDALARQRSIIRWHPLRAFNAINVRVLGTDLITVHVELEPLQPPTRRQAGPIGRPIEFASSRSAPDSGRIYLHGDHRSGPSSPARP